MRKILLTLLSILVMSSVSAQKRNKKHKKSKKAETVIITNEIPIIEVPKEEAWVEAKKFSDKFAAATGKYVFLQKKEEENSDMLTVRYISSSVVNKELYSTDTCKECMDIEFKKSKEGKYTFSNVWGKFADLFPVWKALFNPKAQISDYTVNEQNVLVQWRISYGTEQVTFGRLGTAWFIKI